MVGIPASLKPSEPEPEAGGVRPGGELTWGPIREHPSTRDLRGRPVDFHAERNRQANVKSEPPACEDETDHSAHRMPNDHGIAVATGGGSDISGMAPDAVRTTTWRPPMTSEIHEQPLALPASLKEREHRAPYLGCPRQTVQQDQQSTSVTATFPPQRFAASGLHPSPLEMSHQVLLGARLREAAHRLE